MSGKRRAGFIEGVSELKQSHSDFVEEGGVGVEWLGRRPVLKARYCCSAVSVQTFSLGVFVPRLRKITHNALIFGALRKSLTQRSH